MSTQRTRSSRRQVNRRAFLYGIGGVSIGLPFLASAPDKSAWAASEEPTFALFMGTANGVIANSFWPSQLGDLTSLATDTAAAGLLAEFSERLLFVDGLRYPGTNLGDSHAFAYAQMLTGAPAERSSSGSSLVQSTAASLDVILAPVLNADASPPLTLYSGMKLGYIDEAMSWGADGQVRAAEGNPFTVYTQLVGGAGVDEQALNHALYVRRQSVIDLAREELLRFQARSAISVTDRTRLEYHLAALRDVESSLAELASGTCSPTSLDVAGITAADATYRENGMVEVVSKLQLELAAFAFACNLNHVATLQSGDGQDTTRYDVPSNASRDWTFHWISNEAQSDGSVGNEPWAVQAHIEIDRLRMETLAHGLRKFEGHQLLDKSIVMWANQMSDGRSGSYLDLPIIVAGNPYGRLRSGRYVDFNGRRNGELLTTLAKVLGVEQTIGTVEGTLDDLLA